MEQSKSSEPTLGASDHQLMFQNQMTFNGMPPFFPANLLVQIPQEIEGEKRCVSGSYPQGLNMEEDISDDGLPAVGEKKKRLSLEQVRTLERNFELGNKLEPERKVELARALGLQPRQVAIWFQNRRARWKTKQLEKGYEELKRQLDAMKTENEDLQAQNKKLLCQLLALKGKEASEPINLNKETEGSCSIRSEDSSDVNLEISRAPPMHDSPTDPLQGRIFFPCYRPPSASRPDTSSKSDTARVENSIQEESLCNMFCSTDDQSAFWAWSDQHNYNH